MNIYDTPQLTEEVRRIATSISKNNPGIIAAYSDGSFARSDIVRGSDIDICFIVENGLGEKKIYRKVIGGILFEWGFIEKHRYEDIESILRNAGFVHDLAQAKIWLDKDEILKKIQKRINDRLQEPDFVRERAENQLLIAEQNIEQFLKSIVVHDACEALFHLLPTIRHLCAIPTAVLNCPLTNCRAPLYCKRDAERFGRSEYVRHITTMLGSTGFTENKSTDVLRMAHYVYEKSGLSDEEIQTYRAHLEISDYLIEIGEYDVAVWPMLFWVFGSLIIREITNKEIKENILRNSIPMQEALGLHKIELLSARQEAIYKAMALGKEMITSAFSGMQKTHSH